jgi:hypothetical protein
MQNMQINRIGKVFATVGATFVRSSRSAKPVTGIFCAAGGVAPDGDRDIKARMGTLVTRGGAADRAMPPVVAAPTSIDPAQSCGPTRANPCMPGDGVAEDRRCGRHGLREVRKVQEAGALTAGTGAARENP